MNVSRQIIIGRMERFIIHLSRVPFLHPCIGGIHRSCTDYCACNDANTHTQVRKPRDGGRPTIREETEIRDRTEEQRNGNKMQVENTVHTIGN